MKFNQVTWYSKILALIIFISLPFAGFWLGAKYEKATTVDDTKTERITVSGYTSLIDTDEIAVQTKYEDGLLQYKGRIQVPDPCNYTLKKTTVIAENQNIVEIKLNVEKVVSKSQKTCIQVLTDKQFSGSIETSENSKIVVYFNGEKVE